MKIEIEGEFHDYCVGCPYMRVTSHSAHKNYEGRYFVCDYDDICLSLWSRLSTIRHNPPDLMEQIAAICREKCISVEEAVELFKQL